jgi:hypothetical protein
MNATFMHLCHALVLASHPVAAAPHCIWGSSIGLMPAKST